MSVVTRNRVPARSTFGAGLMILVVIAALLPLAASVAARDQEGARLPRSTPVVPLKVVVDPETIGPSNRTGTRTVPEGAPVAAGIAPSGLSAPDPVVQLDTPSGDAVDSLSAPDVNVAGTLSNANPPDTVGDVGRSHYIQMNNSGTGATNGQTTYQVFDKQGTDASTPAGPIRFGGLWPAGQPCNSDLGDPIVVYDHLADRWLLSQFAQTAATPATNHMCIAISQTPDPTANSWFLYDFDTGVFPDYPKIGVWPDGYYMSTYESPNLGIYVMDRDSMLTGAAATFVKTTIGSLGAPGVRDTRILPADLDGAPPAAGTPNYFVRPVDGQQDPGNPTDRIEIYEFEVDWVANTSSFTLVDTIVGPALAAFDTMTCNRNGGGIRDCITQPDTTSTVDALSNRPMMQLKYRVLGGTPVMVFNQTIDVSGSINGVLGFTPAGEVAGIRWYDLRKGGANWTINQQGTYAPQPNGATTEAQLIHRWMGSAAIDGAGNIALGYSVVNDDDTNGQEIYPGLRYAGRLATDTPNRLPQLERTILNGTNSQTGGNGLRWGDYSAMSVDPVDDCTFWYTNHVAGQGGTGARPTQIASFRFDTCGTDLEIGKVVTPSHPNAGEEIVYTVTVSNNGSAHAPNVVVTDTLPAAVDYLANTDSCTGVAVGASGTLTCPLGDIPAGQSRSFQIKVRIDADLGGATSITNTATVTSDIGDSNPSNDTIGLTHLVNELADVRATKFCKPDTEPAPAGTSGVCSIFVTNDGPSAARGVDLVDTHVSNGAFTLGTATTSTGSCAAPTDSISCSLGKLQPGTTARVDVPVTSDDNVDVNDVARITSDTPDPGAANNEATAGLSFDASADLSITKSGPASATAGTQFDYTVTVDNGGPSAASSVVAVDELPAGATFVSAVASAGTFTAVNGTITWDLGTVAVADPPRTLTITVSVAPDVTAALVNNASVSSLTSDPDTSNNLATWTTAINAVAGLTLTKTDSPDPVVAGANLTYTVTVGNAGPSTAQDVVVTDTLPAGTTLVSAVGGTGTTACAEVQTGIVSCEVGDLDPGESETIFITVTVSPSVPDGTVLVNNAAATSPTDADGAQASASTTVRASAELWMEKTGTAPAGNPAGALIYRLTVHNHAGAAPDDTPTSGAGGPSDAQNVVVVDTLPLDSKKMIVQLLTPSCTYAASTHQVTCTTPTLPAGTSVTHEIQVQIKGSVGTITNVARVTSATADPVTGNNVDTVSNVVQGSTGKGTRPR